MRKTTMKLTQQKFEALPFAEQAKVARHNMPLLVDMGAQLLPHDDVRSFDDARLVELAGACYIVDVKLDALP